MAYNKKTWKARQGLGLNKFSIDGATPVPIINQPDSVTQQGDALSAGNLNDLEQRIADAFDDVVGSEDVLQSQINQHESRLENLEQKAGDYSIVQYRGTNAVPTGKAKYGLVKNIVGKSRAWNQLADIATGSAVGKWHEYNYSTSVTADTANDKIIVKSRGSLGRDVMCRIATIGVSHAFLFSATLKNNYTDREIKANIYKISSSSGSVVSYTISANSQIDVSIVINSNLSDSITQLGVLFGDQSGLGAESTISCDIIKPVIRDLTLILSDWSSSDITTANIPLMVQQVPDLLKYDAYNTSLVDETLSGAKSKGVNIWDEEWESGGYTSQGQEQPDASHFRTKDYIAVLPSTDYYSTNITDRICFYDIGKNFISRTSGGAGNNRSWTTPADCFYIRFEVASPTYSNNIIVALGSTAVTYHPYKTDTLSLSETVTLRGVGTCVETLAVETGVRDDGKFELVDMDDLEWTQVSVYYRASVSGAKLPATPNDIANILSSNYKTVARNYTDHEGDIALETGGTVIVRTPTVPTGMLLYEKATYTPSSPIDPITDNFIEVEGCGTIDTIQEQTPIIDNCLDVGYLTL